MTRPARRIQSVEQPDGPFEAPIDRSGLALPHLRVMNADGSTYEIQAYNPDLIAFEETASRHRWKGPSEAPFRWLTFLAWSASRRTGVIDTGITWEVFAATTLQVENLTTETANPTNAAADRD